MNERIHQVIDGELAREALTPDELRRLAEYEAVIGAAAAEFPDVRSPDLAPGVMARIEALDAAEAPERSVTPPSGRARTDRNGGLRNALSWLWTPRPIALRPAWGLAAAALATVLLTGRPDAAHTPVDVAVPERAAGAAIYVHFRLDAPEANSVHLAGDFTGWEPSYELQEAQPGVWTVVVPLSAGVHDYAFVVDGEQWTPDPLATQVDDGFGGQNSRLSLLPPERMQV